jgi:hypothetical protein
VQQSATSYTTLRIPIPTVDRLVLLGRASQDGLPIGLIAHAERPREPRGEVR